MGNCAFKGPKKSSKLKNSGKSLDFKEEVMGLIKHTSNL